MYDIVIVVFYLIASGVCVSMIYKRISSTSNARRYARDCIGNEVSIHRDKGARFAYKGIYAFLTDNYSKAIKYLEKAMEHSNISHNNSFCFDWLARCYDELEKPSKSLVCCVKAVKSEPDNLKSLFNLADMYMRNGLFSKAEFYYNRILRYDSKNATACFMLGMSFMGRGLYDEAEKQFLKTLELDSKFTSAAAELSVLMAIKGDYSEMDSYYKTAVDNPIAEESATNRKIESEQPSIEPGRLMKRLNSIKSMRNLCNDY